MLVQVIIDLSVPEISASAHISGFLIGFVLGVLLLPRATGAGASTAAA
jgi:membrane associated rhomboid family serine protease